MPNRFPADELRMAADSLPFALFVITTDMLIVVGTQAMMMSPSTNSRSNPPASISCASANTTAGMKTKLNSCTYELNLTYNAASFSSELRSVKPLTKNTIATATVPVVMLGTSGPSDLPRGGYAAATATATIAPRIKNCSLANFHSRCCHDSLGCATSVEGSQLSFVASSNGCTRCRASCSLCSALLVIAQMSCFHTAQKACR